MIKLLLGTSAALALMAGQAFAQSQTSPDMAPQEPPSTSDSTMPPMGEPGANMGAEGETPAPPASSGTTEVQTSPAPDSMTPKETAGSIARDAPLTQALPDVAQEEVPPVDAFVSGQESGELVASDLIEQMLYDTEGTELGTISDVLFDANGQLTAIVVDVGELLGSDKLVAFSIDSLGYKMTDNAIQLVAPLDREALDEAPEFVSLAEEISENDAQSLTKEDGATVPAGEAAPGTEATPGTATPGMEATPGTAAPGMESTPGMEAAPDMGEPTTTPTTPEPAN